jgi:hypothetical protein
MQVLWQRVARGVGNIIRNDCFQIVVLLTLLISPRFLSRTGFQFGLCIVKKTTGIDCPGCGLTRSFIYLCHGNISDSFRLHPLGPIIFLFFCLMLLNRVAKLVLGHIIVPRLESQYTYITLAAALLMVWFRKFGALLL